MNMKYFTREEEIKIRSEFESALFKPMSVPQCIAFCKSVALRPDARDGFPSVVNLCGMELALKIDREHWSHWKSYYVIEKLRKDLDVPDCIVY